jgi:hypothetical protein
LTFILQRYAEWLRDTNAPCANAWPQLLDVRRQLVVGFPGFLCELAYLLACGLLDARFDSLLIPIFLENPQGDLVLSLESRNWGVPSGFWRSRLDDGACILLIGAGPQNAPWIEAAAAEWPRCRFIVAAETALALRGWPTSLRTSSAPSA